MQALKNVDIPISLVIADMFRNLHVTKLFKTNFVVFYTSGYAQYADGSLSMAELKPAKGWILA